MEIEDRDKKENALARRLSKVFGVSYDTMMDYLGDPPEINNIPYEYWTEYETDVYNAISSELNEIFYEQFMHALDSFGLAVDEGTGSIEASDFVQNYNYNLVTGITQTTRNAISKEVTRYIQNGDVTIKDLSKRLLRSYSPVRAEMIAITETTRAAVEGELAVVSQVSAESGIQFMPVWQTANDEIVRECPICWPRHGKDITDGFFPPAHPRCLTGNTLVLAGGDVAAGSKRWYEGNTVIIETLENKLTVTPNHPILTGSGWVAAGDIKEGDKIFGYFDSEWKSLTGINNQQTVATVKDIFSSLDVNGFRVPVSPPDFHNDGAGSKIAIIRSNSKVMNDAEEANIRDPFPKNDLISRYVVSKIPLTALGSCAKLTERDNPVSCRMMSGADLVDALTRSHPAPLDALRFGLGSRPYTGIYDTSSKSTAADTALFSKEVFGFSGNISLQNVIKIRNKYFTGHVYNLQTETGLYVANGIITHNCRCGVTHRVIVNE